MHKQKRWLSACPHSLAEVKSIFSWGHP